MDRSTGVRLLIEFLPGNFLRSRMLVPSTSRAKRKPNLGAWSGMAHEQELNEY